MKNLRIGSKELIKDINKILVIREIRNNGPISRTQISKNTKLVLSTITKICDYLTEQNLITELGEGQSTGGRKPINLEFNNDYGYIIAIHIKHLQVIVSLINLEPKIIKTHIYPYQKNASFDDVEQIMVKAIRGLKRSVERKGRQFLGIGISISGIVDHEMGILTTSTLHGWQNLAIKRILQDQFEVGVYLENNVNCYTLAQKWLGGGKDNKKFICITLENGLRAGIIIDSKLYRGAFGAAGEIGHMIVEAHGRKCKCGQRGCLESYLSGEFIIDASRSTRKERKGKAYSIEEIVNLAEQGDPACVAALERAGEYFGYGLVNVIMHFNPEKIILGVGGMRDKELMIPSTLRVIRENWYIRTKAPQIEVEVDEASEKKYILGASILVLSELFGEPIFEDSSTIVNTPAVSHNFRVYA